MLVDYLGSREIAEFSVNPNNLSMKNTFIDLEVIIQPRSFCSFPVGRSLNPEVVTYANMIFNLYLVKILQPFVPNKFPVGQQAFYTAPSEQSNKAGH